MDSPGQKRLRHEHDGYRRQGVIHRRTVSARADGSWVVEDELLPAGKKPAADNTGKNPPPGPGEVGQPSWSARLHWLLPNWEWEMEKNSQDSRESGVSLRLKSPFGWVQLAVSYPKGTEISAPRASLCRAGEILFGEALAEPTRGWFSPTYGYKFPALSFAIETDSTRLPLSLQSLFMFPEA